MVQCLRKFLLPDDCYLEAGKIKVLMNLLEQYKKERRRMLIFSQVCRPSVLMAHLVC